MKRSRSCRGLGQPGPALNSVQKWQLAFQAIATCSITTLAIVTLYNLYKRSEY